MILSAEAFRDYVETRREEIFEEMFLEFKSSIFLNHYSGVKGEVLIPVSSTNADNVVHKWQELHVDDGRQSVDLNVTPVRSYLAQFHERYVPTRLEKSYLGYMRKTGQDPEDFPFEAFVVAQLIKAMNQFSEKCVWKSVADGASTSGMALYDGLLKQVADAVTAGDIIPQAYGIPYLQKYKAEAIPTGYASILDIVEGIANSFSDEMRAGGAHMYMPNLFKTMYNQAYRNVHGTHPTTAKLYNIDRTIVDGTDDDPVYIHGVGGMAGSQRIIATKMENTAYAYDDANDVELMKLQYILNVLHMFGDFRIGSTFIKKDNDWIKCNDLA